MSEPIDISPRLDAQEAIAMTSAMSSTSWPPLLPHRLIDDLLDRIETGSYADPADVLRLLSLVAQEGRRLRAEVARLSTRRLLQAEVEARQVLVGAIESARGRPSAGLTALRMRLNGREADGANQQQEAGERTGRR